MNDTEAPDALAETVGPVHTTDTLAAATRRSRSEVEVMIGNGELLALSTRDGVDIIPAFQLDDDLRPLAGIKAVLGILDDTVVDRWTAAMWLTAPLPQLDGRSVVEHLRGGGAPDAAADAARAARARWQR